jgi:hypothetical protein
MSVLLRQFLVQRRLALNTIQRVVVQPQWAAVELSQALLSRMQRPEAVVEVAVAVQPQ